MGVVEEDQPLDQPGAGRGALPHQANSGVRARVSETPGDGGELAAGGVVQGVADRFGLDPVKLHRETRKQPAVGPQDALRADWPQLAVGAGQHRGRGRHTGDQLVEVGLTHRGLLPSRRPHLDFRARSSLTLCAFRFDRSNLGWTIG